MLIKKYHQVHELGDDDELPKRKGRPEKVKEVVTNYKSTKEEVPKETIISHRTRELEEGDELPKVKPNKMKKASNHDGQILARAKIHIR